MDKYLKKLCIRFASFFNRHSFLLAISIASCLIGVSVGLGWYNNKVVPSTYSTIARYSAEPSNPLSFMSNWDGPDYISIAKLGYQNYDQTNFFPLYPILIRGVHYVIRSYLDSALLVSWVFIVGAIYFYLKILKRLFDFQTNISAIQALVFLILFPTAIFMVATYSESLLLFSGLAAVYFALKKNYLAAGIFGLICTISNTDGILALILACMILLEEKVKLLKVTTTFIVGLLGLAGYSFYLNDRFSKPLGFILSQQGHGWLNHHYSELLQTIQFFNVIFIILLILAIIYWWKRRLSFSIYSFLFLLIPIVGNQFGGFNRYVLMAFPLQWMAYDYLKNKHLAYSLTLAAMGIAWAYFVLQYAGGYVGG